jgi:hypothetical protein
MENLSYVGTPKDLMYYLDDLVADFENEREQSIRSDYSDNELQNND